MNGLSVILTMALFVLILAMSLFFVIIVLCAKNKIEKCNNTKKTKMKWLIIGGLYIFVCITIIIILIFTMF